MGIPAFLESQKWENFRHYWKIKFGMWQLDTWLPVQLKQRGVLEGLLSTIKWPLSCTDLSYLLSRTIFFFFLQRLHFCELDSKTVFNPFLTYFFRNNEINPLQSHWKSNTFASPYRNRSPTTVVSHFLQPLFPFFSQ